MSPREEAACPWRTWTDKESNMFLWGLIFLVLAVVAAILGFGVLVGVLATIAKWLFVLFLALFIIGLIFRRSGGGFIL